MSVNENPKNVDIGKKMSTNPTEQNEIELRQWFENMVFSGKSLAQISKIPKSELVRLESEYAKLTALIQRKVREALIAELEPMLPQMTIEGYSFWVRDKILDRLATLKKEEE